MYLQIEKISGNKRRESINPRTRSITARNAKKQTEQQVDSIAQLMLVAQLATRQSSPVRFDGSGYTLEQLILRWGPPRGTAVVATQTDHVGGMFTVRFTNNGGPAISKATADEWVQRGIEHADD